MRVDEKRHKSHKGLKRSNRLKRLKTLKTLKRLKKANKFSCFKADDSRNRSFGIVPLLKLSIFSYTFPVPDY